MQEELNLPGLRVVSCLPLHFSRIFSVLPFLSSSIYYAILCLTRPRTCNSTHTVRTTLPPFLEIEPSGELLDMKWTRCRCEALE